ncbi:hypothetical protein QFZ58_000676 [Streptomyces sp. B1I3]|nr:hypothetical protein [Streptomyces sp. B1I3]
MAGQQKIVTGTGERRTAFLSARPTAIVTAEQRLFPVSAT